MAKIKTHCEDCNHVFGKPFKEVHEWMDYFAKKWNPFTYLEYHRQFRHHDKGVQECIKEFGHYAGQAAKLHMIRDFELFLKKPVNFITLREDDIDELYESILQYCHVAPELQD